MSVRRFDMPKAKAKKPDEIKTRAPLTDTGVVPATSILKEGGPTKPPLKVEVEVAPSIVKEGPTKPPILG
jgi:hypothetical protein